MLRKAFRLHWQISAEAVAKGKGTGQPIFPCQPTEMKYAVNQMSKIKYIFLKAEYLNWRVA